MSRSYAWSRSPRALATSTSTTLSWGHQVRSAADELRQEIERFFSIYKDLEEGKTVTVEGWRSREEAIAEIAASRVRLERAS
jgi:inorganic pyrophosphatase